MIDLKKYNDVFEKAKLACQSRHSWSPYPEMSSKYPNWAAEQERALQTFEAQLGQRFELDQPAIVGWIGEEVSPYTQLPLHIQYPQANPDDLFTVAEKAIDSWAKASIDERIAVLMDVLDVIFRSHLFEIANAVMHTAGQSANMAYAGSGVNALDRGIEALVYAEQAMRSVTPQATWERCFGHAQIVLDKQYQIIPRGVAVCFTCASFPTWNAWPSMMANLATGNAVIVKPHPATVLPMAISVRVFRQVLKSHGFDPNLVTMCLDSTEQPLGKYLVQHSKTAMVDFTGSARFGQWVEKNAYPAIAFTETAGCNTVVLHSANDLDAVLRSLATTLCMFSAQMCTSPQNIYIPKNGMNTPQGRVGLDEVAKRLAQAVAQVGSDPKKASMILATIQSPQTIALLKQLEYQGSERGEVLLSPQPYVHPDFPNARTSTPLMLKVSTHERDLYGEEQFGPISFVIACEDDNDAIEQATKDVRELGGLTAFLYSTDESYIQKATHKYARAGAQLTINLTGPMPLNFAAAYSDYHVTGLNKAGTASLTHLAFVANRFCISQSRRPRIEN